MPIDYKDNKKQEELETKITNENLKTIFTTCLKSKLNETLNLPLNESILDEFTPDHNKKFDYEKHCIKKFTFTLDEFKFKT